MPNFYDIKNLESGNKADIYIHDQIGSSWFDEGIDSKGFIASVSGLGDVSELNVHINSPGGNVYDGIAMYNYLKDHDATVNVYVDGVAASIASVIAMAGDTITMGTGSTMFIHNPFSWAVGDADEMRTMADTLDKIRDSIIDIYQTQTEMTREDIIDLMNSETTMTASEAISWGFATSTDEKIVYNGTFDKDDLKAVVMKQVEDKVNNDITNSYKNKIAELENSLESIEKEFGDLTEQVKQYTDPADADYVVAACKEHKILDEAGKLIDMGMTKTQVDDAVKFISNIKDICIANDLDAGKVLASFGDGFDAMLRVALNEQAIRFDGDINNHFTSGQGTQARVPNMTNIYAKRKIN